MTDEPTPADGYALWAAMQSQAPCVSAVTTASINSQGTTDERGSLIGEVEAGAGEPATLHVRYAFYDDLPDYSEPAPTRLERLRWWIAGRLHALAEWVEG